MATDDAASASSGSARGERSQCLDLFWQPLALLVASCRKLTLPGLFMGPDSSAGPL